MSKFSNELQGKSNEANSKENNKNDTTGFLTHYSNIMKKTNNVKNTGKCRMSVRIS